MELLSAASVGGLDYYTDRHNHRLVAANSETVPALTVLARAHQSTIWSKGRQTKLLRSTLREFYLAALVAFDDLGPR